ncbi:SURF1 family protein [Pseudoalteromonas sp. JBTF-M23]|uniref:SURF1-like protein n=1 Tax=Pseudoalteromonas caenipelagi TaxID=2726988 RepID=A0A849VHJ5_9GAMM|nr:SURF1 family protein [Pseudoalteromonas caenipelagi]NOU52755.1 SURF1 family protein [Pseudoalteromonas caenipelagi]
MQQRVKLKSSSVITLVLVSLVVLVCLILALWQWQRALDKQQLIYQQQQQLGLNSKQILTLPPQSNNGLSTTITGQFIEPFVWFLDNQVLDGQIGFDVLALLRLSSDTDKQVLVNLGFIAAKQGRQTPIVKLPTHQVSLDVLIKSQDLVGFTLATQPNMNSEQPQLLQYIDLAFLSQSSQETIYPLVAYQQGEKPILAKPHYQHVVMSADKHKAYALQWLLIAFAAAVIAYVAIKKGKQS